MTNNEKLRVYKMYNSGLDPEPETTHSKQGLTGAFGDTGHVMWIGHRYWLTLMAWL